MYKSFMKILLLIAVIILSGCYSQKKVQQLRQNQILVDAGMSKQEVMTLLGTPGDRQLNGDLEAWQYCSSSLTTFEFVVVWFFNKKVGSVTTYKTYTCPTLNCNQCFRSVNFEAPPDAIIELRNKHYNR